jgi:hypothetical protein
MFSGAAGQDASAVNGTFKLTKDVVNGKPVFVKVGDPTVCLW